MEMWEITPENMATVGILRKQRELKGSRNVYNKRDKGNQCRQCKARGGREEISRKRI